MRIVQLVENLEVGGLERVAVDLALSQRARGHEVMVYCLFGAGPLRVPVEAAGISVVELHKERLSKLALVRAMAAQLGRDRADVIHGHNPGVHHFAAVAKRAAGVPACVNTRHSAADSSGRPYQERYFRWVQPWTDHVIFDCDFVRQKLAPELRYPPAKCSVILNGIELAPFENRRAAPGSRGSAIRFGTIGRLVPAKGHAILIDAFACVAHELPHASLHIYGYGPLEGDLRAQVCDRGMEGRICLEGRTTDPAGALESLDVFVLSSVTEGLPLVILEALAAGLPVVSTRVGGVPEVAPEGTTAWLCPPNDTAALAEALRTAAASPNLASMGAAGRELALANYGLDRMTELHLRLYETVLRERC